MQKIINLIHKHSKKHLKKNTSLQKEYIFDRPLTKSDKEIVNKVYRKTMQDFGKTIEMLKSE